MCIQKSETATSVNRGRSPATAMYKQPKFHADDDNKGPFSSHGTCPSFQILFDDCNKNLPQQGEGDE